MNIGLIDLLVAILSFVFGVACGLKDRAQQRQAERPQIGWLACALLAALVAGILLGAAAHKGGQWSAEKWIEEQKQINVQGQN